MNVEMPEACRQGEQIGIRVTVFNYMMKDIEVMVVLANSPYYKFIHVESYGFVQSYNPRTSSGEHQHLVWIKAQDAVQVHLPIVPTVLGSVDVNVKVVAQIARDEVTKTIRVEVKRMPRLWIKSFQLISNGCCCTVY
jgi:CD109 antigen